MVKLNALKKVGSFSGEGDVERWLDRLELAMRIDGIPEDSHADVLSLHLEGAAYDTWKGMEAAAKSDANKIKAELRSVFGLQIMEAWRKVMGQSPLTPGDTVDVAYAETRQLIRTVAAGGDAADRVAACAFVCRLPSPVRDQVLIQCGKEMQHDQVVACAKQLMSSATSSQNVLAAGVDSAKSQNAGKTGRNGLLICGICGRRGHDETRCKIECFRCRKRGHIARNCHEEVVNVSGNGHAGQHQA